MRTSRHAVLVLSVFLLVIAGVGPTSAATVLLEATWGGPVSEVTGGAAVAPDGATYLTGFTTSFDPFGEEELFLVKLATDGTLSWQRTWEGPDQFANDRGTEVAVGPDGSVYVTGSTLGQRGDVLLLKFSSDGALLWQRRWDGGGTERGEDVAVGGDGSIHVTGGTNSFGENQLFVLKFGPDGTLVWQRTWGPAAGLGIAIGPDGNLVVAGNAGDPDDLVILKIDPAGTLVWQTTYAAEGDVDARGGVTVASDGSVYVAGVVQEFVQKVVVDAVLIKFGSDGSLLWDRSWGGRSGDTGEGVAVLPDGRAAFVGDTNSFGAGIDDAFVLIVSPGGRGLDGNTWGGLQIDHAPDVDIGPGGTIAIGALTQTPPPYTFQRASTRLSRLRGAAAAPVIPLLEAAGTVADPGGTVATPPGSTTFAGGTDAALVRIAP